MLILLRVSREPILDETDKILRDFYKPYNQILAKALGNEDYLWIPELGASLREQLTISEAAKAAHPGPIMSNMHNPHSAHAARRGDEPQGAEDYRPASPAELGSPSNLRGGVDSHNMHPQRGFTKVKLTPQRFNISGLDGADTDPSMIVNWLKENVQIVDGHVPESEEEAGEMLAHAVIALDLAALKFLLYDLGVPPHVTNSRDRGKNAFDTLACLGIIAEGHGKSVVYSLLKGKPSWLHEVFDPPLPLKLPSVHSIDIIDSLSKRINAVIAWLDRAGVSVTTVDQYDSNILHFAVNGGIKPLVEYALNKGVDPNLANYDMRTPLHIAASLGRVEILKLLIDHGGDMHKADDYNVTAYEMVANPGPIQPDDAIHILGIKQRPPRLINRFLHPEIESDAANPLRGWNGTGGWGIERQPGFEDDMECACDQYYANEITADEIFSKYIARNSPVLIRGLLREWPAINKWSKDVLKSEFGELNVQVSWPV
jgi:hypothetical protein